MLISGKPEISARPPQDDGSEAAEFLATIAELSFQAMVAPVTLPGIAARRVPSHAEALR
jgi:hypothetical protein